MRDLPALAEEADQNVRSVGNEWPLRVDLATTPCGRFAPWQPLKHFHQ